MNTTSNAPSFLDSMFSDEAAGAHKKDDKPFEAQCAIARALGLDLVDLRFAQFAGPTRNVMDWEPAEIETAQRTLDKYGLAVNCIGSPVGKCGLPENDAAFQKYLDSTVRTACDRADAFDAVLVRVFGFYPWITDKDETVSETVRAERFKLAKDFCAKMADYAETRGKLFCMELESGLFGRNGGEIAEICEHTGSQYLCGLFDGANSLVQQHSEEACIADWRAMKHVQGPVIHWKDFKIPADWNWDGDEDALRHFCPVDEGDSGHEVLFEEFGELAVEKGPLYQALGVEGFRGTAEPHVKGGGQFGGYSGPDGMAVAMNAIRTTKRDLFISGSNELSWSDIQQWKSANMDLQ